MDVRVKVRAIILDNKYRLLTVLHRDVKKGEIWYYLPGGIMEGLESTPEALMRIVFEEYGLRCIPGRILYIQELVEKTAGTHWVEIFMGARLSSQQEDQIEQVDQVEEEGESVDLEEQPIRRITFLAKEELRRTAYEVYPEILRGQFWLDLGRRFQSYQIYLGQKVIGEEGGNS